MASETTQPGATIQAITLAVPPPGQTVVMVIQPNQVIDVPFDMAEAEVTLVGNDLRLEFPGEAVLILTDFAEMVESGSAPLMMLADGSVMAGDVILTALTAELLETAAGPGGGSGGAGEYEDDMGDLIAGITRLGPQDPDPFAQTVDLQLLDEQPLLPEVPVPVPVPGNNPPVAEDNVYRLTAGELKAILANEGIFSNDYDPDGDPISFSSAGNPPSVTINTADGSLTIDATTASELYDAYQALDDGESLSFTFPYTITDPGGLTATANVTIIVEGSNDPPVITTDAGNPEGANDLVYESGLNPNGSDAAANTEFAYGTFKISDPDGLDDIVNVTINGTVIAIADLGSNNVIAGTSGTLTITGYNALTGEGTYQYELTSRTDDLAGPETDVFTLTTSDGTATSAEAYITIEIVDDLPTAVNDSGSVTEDTVLTTTGNVLDNDASGADVPKEFVSWDSPLQGSWGTLTDNGNGGYTYTLDNAAVQFLDTGETRTDSFDYTMKDADGDEKTATLTITINGSNDVPTITTDPGNPEGANDLVYESGLSPNGSDAGADTEFASGTFQVADPDGLGDIVSVTINGTVIAIADLGSNNVIAGTSGTLTITGYNALTGEGTYQYELTSRTDDLAGPETDVFTLTTSDGTATSAEAYITIEIVDDLPTAVNDSGSVTEDTVLTTTGNVLDNDASGADVPKEFVSWDSPLQGSWGTLTDNGSGGYTYTLDNAAVQFLDTGETRTDSFDYTMKDADGDEKTATLTITINGSNESNEPPTITTDPGNPEGANDLVYESGLSPNGSDAGADTEFAYGTFQVADPDGLDDIVSVTINGTVIAIADLGSNNAIAGTSGMLTITGYNPLTGEGTYQYELTSRTDDLAGPETDVFTLTTSDGTATSAEAYITIEIVDDLPTVAFSNSYSPVDNTVLVGVWDAQTGADILPSLDYVNSLVLDSVKVDGLAAAITTPLTPGGYTPNGALSYSGAFTYGGSNEVSFTVELKTDGTYVVELSATPTQVTIDPSEFAGAVKASGPTDTYLISYQDTESGEIVTAKASVAVEGTALSLVGVANATGTTTTTFSALTVGDEVNPSSDGIGIENNIINSYVDNKTGALTAESLKFDPTGEAESITLNFKASGAPGFGQSGSHDVLYIKVFGSEGGTQTLMLDSRYGDFVINPDGTASAIAGGYAGGGLNSYAIDNPFGSGSIDYIEVTAGFYTTSKGIGTTEVKVSFGFTTETVTTFDLPVEMNFTAEVIDSDGDTATASFVVQTVSGNEFTGSDSSDMLTGTEGNDLLTGGDGADIFAYSANGNEGHDVITDFKLADGDVLRFHDVLDDGSGTLDAGDVNVTVDVSGADVQLTINGTTTVTMQGVNSGLGLSDGAHSLSDLIDSGMNVQFDPNSHSI